MKIFCHHLLIGIFVKHTHAFLITHATGALAKGGQREQLPTLSPNRVGIAHPEIYTAAHSAVNINLLFAHLNGKNLTSFYITKCMDKNF